MKRILLINPFTIHIARNCAIYKEIPMPPLGLLYLAAYVMKHSDHQVKICDMEIGDKLDEFLSDYHPHIVGIYAITFNWYDVLQILDKIKKFDNSIKTVIGGPQADIYPRESINFDQVDYVVRGDGEIPFLKLLSGNEEEISEEGFNDNLDELPYPARNLINIHRYRSLMSGVPSTNMIASRNCPAECIFCYQPRAYRYRSAGNIFGEMQELRQMGIQDITFYDDTFTWNRDRTIELCDMLIHSKMNMSWNVRTRIDKVDKNLLVFMREAGCNRIKYGIESGNNLILNTLQKNIRVSQTEQTIRWTREAKIESEAYIILGSPGETEKQMSETISFVNRMTPDYVIYQFATPTPNTVLYEQIIAKDVDYWKDFIINPISEYFIKFLNSDSKLLTRMWKKAMYSFYLRPVYILNRVLKIRSFQSFILQFNIFLILLSKTILSFLFRKR